MDTTVCALPTAATSRLCLHCGANVPSRSASEYCCSGCETVHGILTRSGLDRYYSILKSTGEQARTVGSLRSDAGSRPYAWLDDSSLRSEYESADGIRFYLEGVHCAACVWLVEKLPQLVPSVASARLDLGAAVVTVRLHEYASGYADAAAGLLRIGYRPHPIRRSEAEEAATAENRRLLVQLGIAGMATGNIMLLAVSLYAGADGAFASQFRWVSFLLSLPVMFYSALPFYRSTWQSLRARHLSIDVPVALGLQVSFWVSVANLFRGHDAIYFDSISGLVFLLLSTRYFLRRVQRTSLSAASLAHHLMPATARRVSSDGSIAEVPLAELKSGDQLEVLPGDLIPSDAVVLQGRSSIDASLLTGESLPETIETGAKVFGGTQNLTGVLRLEVTERGRDSRVGRILQSMEASIASRAPIVAFSDRISRAFISVTLLLIPIVFVGGLTHGWQEALDRALALALVTCPCAFALATPLSFAATLGRAARAGILIKGAEILERLSRIDTAFLDKTGTLTEGRYQVLEWSASSALSWNPAALIVALESSSRHPVARALVEHFRPELASAQALPELQDHAEIQGRGVSARWNEKLYRLEAARESSGASHTSNGRAVTCVELREDDVLLGTAVLGDPIRSDAARAVNALRELGVRPRILSGDAKEAVETVAGAVGIPTADTTAKADPERKKQALEGQSNALMVGDGANDAVALATASVGVAVHGGLEASVRASDIYLSRPGLGQLPLLIVLGRETLKVVKRNFIVSLGYNAIAVTAAVTGHVDPLFAAILMPISAFAVFVSANLGTRRLREALESVSRGGAA